MQENFLLCWKTQKKLTRGVVIISLHKQLFVNIIEWNRICLSCHYTHVQLQRFAPNAWPVSDAYMEENSSALSVLLHGHIACFVYIQKCTHVRFSPTLEFIENRGWTVHLFEPGRWCRSSIQTYKNIQVATFFTIYFITSLFFKPCLYMRINGTKKNYGVTTSIVLGVKPGIHKASVTT